ncbi:MAG: SLC13 family permease [Desulfotomaculales bacterium]
MYAVLAVIVCAVIFWVFNLLPGSITALLVMGSFLALGMRPELVFNGFTNPSFWLLVSVLFYGHVVEKTGLGRRICFFLLARFGTSYPGILFAFFLTGALLSLGIPSMTVRTAIMVPIAWTLVKELQLEERSPESAAILFGAVLMAVVPGLSFLTGSLWGPFFVGLFPPAEQQAVSWGNWLKVFGLPAALLSFCVIPLIQLCLRPRALTLRNVGSVARLAGPLSREEKIAAAIITLAVFGWTTQSWHGVSGTITGMVCLALFFAAGLLRESEIGAAVSWHLVLYAGGLMGLAKIIEEYGFHKLLAVQFLKWFAPDSGGVFYLTACLFILTLFLKFFDPMGFLTLAILFLITKEAAVSSGIQPLVLGAVIIFPAHVFWFSYQSLPVLVGEGITGGRAWSSRQRYVVATFFTLVTMAVVLLSIFFWRVTGAIA